MEPNNPSCANCKWWRIINTAQRIGMCHSPVAAGIEDLDAITYSWAKCPGFAANVGDLQKKHPQNNHKKYIQIENKLR